MKYHLLWCNVHWSAGSYFFTNDNFPGTFFDFRFMMFTKVLMKELARILIHVRKIFNYKVSFKMLLLMYLVMVKKRLEFSCDFGMALSNKLPEQWRKSLSSKYPFLTLLLNKINKNKYIQYHDISISFKNQVY